MALGKPNSFPSAGGSEDYDDTLMQIKILKHRCVEPTNRSANSEKNCKPKCKPGKTSNTPYCGRTRDVLKRRRANIIKEARYCNTEFCLNTSHASDVTALGEVFSGVEN
jgi:hypothetical protein